MMEYHTIILYWTILMSLRLLMRDMLALMAKMTAHELPAQPRQTIEDHRVQLMSYALKVLQAICYATLPESRAVTPFFLATAFQLTVAVLDQEHKSLQAAGSNQETIRRCGSLKSLAAHYLDWAMQNKIPIKLDFDAPREWKCESVAQLSQLISLKSL
ncbi:hypothetical protein M406DRAFT_358638 [Cryphonectria parasitica EP155]|uniref:Uncharacterized protein n=1 Tax=Cryphonectria parasitica (strain ATCC 38755 / EP155) TaxID=660469 RepID=A0A9P4XSE8_CRYP1|nr:uncharacterized protein M406DRAFT_358638 [Cryphonectria parasitica EP155]KAF3759885.1 hypothetical protein M406DRAFT_358638 [Cryphonectria parasitica EP155]